MLKLFQMSSLEKLTPGGGASAPSLRGGEYASASALRGEVFSYQIIYYSDERQAYSIDAKAVAPNGAGAGGAFGIKLYDVENVPCGLPAYPHYHDEHYLSTAPGLFPDLLCPVANGEVVARPADRALWVSVSVAGDAPAGDYELAINFSGKDGACMAKTLALRVAAAKLPPQELICTQWFHSDCISSFYNVGAFSEEHWRLLDGFVEMAAAHGINMILTPIFTPPLDTQIGGERPTVQLVGIEKRGGEYTFDFSLLKRWIEMCRGRGVKYFEMAHLFTQWGALCTPKIIATEGGKPRRIFGWDVAALSPEYRNFLDRFLPALTAFLREAGADKSTYFHISDEPHGEEMLAQYKKAKEIVARHLEGFKIIDALSEYEFYKSGAVENPIPANNAIEPFLAAGIKDLWTYYCCGQAVGVSNRFIAMPSYRNRIIGIQMYKYGIAGFLQWGYNFYYSQHSKRLINPFVTTDADYAFPSGDAFSVYPGANGPLPSLRLKVFYEALQDMRALSLLEKVMPKNEIIAMIEDAAGMEITFSQYPQNPEFILDLRANVNAVLAKNPI